MKKYELSIMIFNKFIGIKTIEKIYKTLRGAKNQGTILAKKAIQDDKNNKVEVLIAEFNEMNRDEYSYIYQKKY